MGNVKRYDIETSIGQDWEAKESKHGEFVRQEDYAALMREYVRVTNLASALQIQLERFDG